MEPGEPDRVTEEVVTGLMAELRKAQAEAAYWKAAAERLQREADGALRWSSAWPDRFDVPQHEIGGDVAEVRAEMVANVWKVVASQGDAVEDGDTLVILESMKMEIPVLAEGSAARSSQLRVAEGQVVQEGDVIAVIG